MSRVKSKNTKPEIIVRKLVYGLGYRYRLHDASLPGKPDLVFRTRRKIIFINGCFWHSHKDCPKARVPKTRQDFWKNKMQNNAKRDEENQYNLGLLGWEFLVIWQCQTNDLESLEKLIIEFLGD